MASFYSSNGTEMQALIEPSHAIPTLKAKKRDDDKTSLHTCGYIQYIEPLRLATDSASTQGISV